MSSNLHSSLDAVLNAGIVLMDHLSAIQPSENMLPHDGEGHAEFLKRFTSDEFRRQLEDPEDEGYGFELAMTEYATIVAETMLELDEHLAALEYAIEQPGVKDALRRAHSTAITIDQWTSYSYAEVLLEIAGLYVGNRRLACWRFNIRDYIQSIHNAHWPPTLPDELLKRLPELLESVTLFPRTIRHDVGIRLEKEVAQAKELSGVPLIDPWSIDMLSLFEARGGHLTDSERDIYEIVKAHGGLIAASEIESVLSSKYGDSKTGSAANALAFLTRCTILTKGPGGRGYQIAKGAK